MKERECVGVCVLVVSSSEIELMKRVTEEIDEET